MWVFQGAEQGHDASARLGPEIFANYLAAKRIISQPAQTWPVASLLVSCRLFFGGLCGWLVFVGCFLGLWVGYFFYLGFN